MAGLFYLPRIFVHHQEGSNAGEDVRRLVTMAKKLFGFSSVMMVLAIVPGMVLWLGYGFNGGWMHAKLGFVGLLWPITVNPIAIPAPRRRPDHPFLTLL